MHDRVLAWLGYWRDEMPPEAVKQLQQICSDTRKSDDGWRTMESAPKDGTSMLLFVEPIDSYEICGWHPDRHIEIVIGWWDNYGWRSPLMEEGTADTEGYSSAVAISITPTAWRPLPSPPEG